jgi:hypothetical protein
MEKEGEDEIGRDDNSGCDANPLPEVSKKTGLFHGRGVNGKLSFTVQLWVVGTLRIGCVSEYVFRTSFFM